MSSKSVRLGRVRVLLVGDSAAAATLAEELETPDLAVERWPEHPPPANGDDEIAAIARELRELERALGQDGPDAVLLASDSSAAVAAILVATKLGTPVGRVEPITGDPAGANMRLIAQLADAALAPVPAAIVDWLRDTYTPRA
jgi:UDP-N-acetylglucosamine 2-epimerase